MIEKHRILELSIYTGTLICSILGLTFLIWQNSILQEQTTNLAESLENQRSSIASSKSRDSFEIKKYLIGKFTPNYNSRILPPVFDKEKSSFLFYTEIDNTGENTIVVSDDFTYEAVRCNTKETWSGSNWKPFEDLSSENSASSTEETENDGIEFERKPKYDGHVTPGSPSLVTSTLTIPKEDLELILPGEMIAIEIALVIYDPDQELFKQEMIDTNFSYGPRLTIDGKEVTYPRIKRLRGQVNTFQKVADGWEPVEHNKKCLDYVI